MSSLDSDTLHDLVADKVRFEQRKLGDPFKTRGLLAPTQ